MTRVAHPSTIPTDLTADPERGLPEGRMGITLKHRDELNGISAGWLHIGAETPRSSRTVSFLDGDLNVGLSQSGQFVALEMLRRPDDAECRLVLDWAHRNHVQGQNEHLPCLALRTLREAWDRYDRLLHAMNKYHLAPLDEQVARALFDVAVTAGIDPRKWTKRPEEAAC